MILKKKGKSKTGLLFSPIKAYEEKVWKEAFRQARERGLSYDEAKRHADEALRYAKEAAKKEIANAGDR